MSTRRTASVLWSDERVELKVLGSGRRHVRHFDGLGATAADVRVVDVVVVHFVHVVRVIRVVNAVAADGRHRRHNRGEPFAYLPRRFVGHRGRCCSGRARDDGGLAFVARR